MSTNAPAHPIRLHRFVRSGHSHRVQLFLSLLGIPVELVDVALDRGAHRSPGFLALNRFGQVPVIEDGEVTLADSNAILVYLAGRHDPAGQWLPRDPVGAARVQVWLSVAAGPLAAGPAAARRAVVFGGAIDPRAVAEADRLLALIDGVLASSRFLVGDRPTIADLAIYTYAAHAPEGGVSLERHEHVRAWLARIEALEGFVPMAPSPIPRTGGGDVSG
ncbi:MAG TPA: glutathione S-transferase family protein [Kofleriaceae bacterium]|nr:glutathione S-transferase family protein [Kofleriaceae bacterium]